MREGTKPISLNKDLWPEKKQVFRFWVGEESVYGFGFEKLKVSELWKIDSSV